MSVKSLELKVLQILAKYQYEFWPTNEGSICKVLMFAINRLWQGREGISRKAASTVTIKNKQAL